MLKTIKVFFESKLVPATAEEPESGNLKTDLASACLLIEVMKSDHELDDREAAEFIEILQKQLDISDEDLADLVTLAEAEAKQATSLYEFTSLINAGYDYENKLALIENMWRVAYADERLDKYEEHLIRKISDLIYVSHKDFIRTKHSARSGAAN
ncbi:MAG: TerB family tellurite resistance protein [Pseudohongiellaceae bacterium]